MDIMLLEVLIGMGQKKKGEMRLSLKQKRTAATNAASTSRRKCFMSVSSFRRTRPREPDTQKPQPPQRRKAGITPGLLCDMSVVRCLFAAPVGALQRPRL